MVARLGRLFLVPDAPTEPTESDLERERYEPFLSLGIIVGLVGLAVLAVGVFELVTWLGWGVLAVGRMVAAIAGSIWAFHKRTRTQRVS